MEEKVFEDEYVKFSYKGGILYGSYKVSLVDLDVARHATKERLKYFNGEDYPTLADYSNIKETSKEARDFFATHEATQKFKAIAVLTNSLVGNMIYNFYIILSKPTIPTKLFSDKDEAIKWLKGFLEHD